VKQSGGEIRIASEPGRGTRFSILLPCAHDEQPTAPEVEDVGAATAQATGTILVVEDDEPVRRLLTRVLRQAGFEVLAACDGLEAATLFSANADRVDLAITDVVMPGMSGPETIAVLRKQAPALPAVFITGYSHESLRRGHEQDEWLAKPFSAATLLPVVRRALAR